MLRLVQGDDTALNELINKYGQDVLNLVYHITGNIEVAEDLAQETFVKVYLARDSFNTKKRFKTWLFTIALNLAKNYLRWQARHPAVSMESAVTETDLRFSDIIPDNSPSPSQVIDNKECAEAIKIAINSLPYEQRMAVVLCEINDLSVAEAAKVLNLSIKSVESHLYRARKTLREALKDWI